MYSINYASRIDGQVKVNTVIWTVHNFINLLEDKKAKELRTSKPTGTVELKFQLKMKFLGHDKELIELYYLSPTTIFLKTILTICIKRFDEKSIVIKEYHSVDANKWELLGTLYKRDIVTFEGRDLFLLDDGSFRFNIQFLVATVEDEFSPFAETVPGSDLENILNDKTSDITMKSLEGVEFKVHKAILSSQSVVLKAYFEHNTTECHTNIIESPFEAEVLKSVLTFIYCQKIPGIKTMPDKLLSAADYYQLNRLMTFCEKSLIIKLNVENAIDTLQLADFHSAKTLKLASLQFIKDGPLDILIKTKAWTKLQSVQLIKTMYEHLASDDTT